MKKDQIIDAVGQLDESVIAEADAVRVGVKKKKIGITKIVAAAASIAVIAGGIFVVRSMPNQTVAADPEMIAEAVYPELVQYPTDPLAENYSDEYQLWRESRYAHVPEEGYADGLDGYFRKTVGEFLTDTEGKNRVFSPLSLYMALSMAAETADGESRAQILDLIGHDSIESLRTQANAVWRGNYSNDGATTSIMANSLWFDTGLAYNIDTVNTIADHYYASVYHGDMGSDSLNNAIHEWLNMQTGGLLEESVEQIETTTDMIMALFSTVYYRAKWASEFNPEYNETMLFHSPSGDTEEEFMYKLTRGNYYWSENFGAISLRMENSGQMWLVLPDEGVTPEQLMNDEKLYELTCSGNQYLSEEDWPDQKNVMIHLRLPKFDASSDFKLTEGLKKLGITDIFDSSVADLTPLVGEDSGMKPSYTSAKQAARVVVDEEGVTAAAYTAMMMAGAARPPEEEVEFTLDRPFFFALSHNAGLPLFTGIVNEP